MHAPRPHSVGRPYRMLREGERHRPPQPRNPGKLRRDTQEPRKKNAGQAGQASSRSRQTPYKNHGASETSGFEV